MPAHKSDIVRYLLLKTFGGVWVDATVFIFHDLSYLIKNKTFVVPYMNMYQGINLFFGDPKMKISAKEGSETKLIKADLIDSIQINKDNLNSMFIPENYFIASTKNHFILNHVIEQLKKFWELNINYLDGTNYDEILVNYMCEITYDNIFSSKKWNYKPTNKDQFIKMWKDAAYLFNYVQLYYAIKDFLNEQICNEEKSLKITSKSNEQSLTDMELYNSNFYEKECKLNSKLFDSCVDEIFKCKSDDVIHLISASYLRLFRKNESKEVKTYYEQLLSKNIYDDFKKILYANRQYFIKVSSFTINNPFVEELFNFIEGNIDLKTCENTSSTAGGRKYRKHKNTHKKINKKKSQKKINKKRSQKRINQKKKLTNKRNKRKTH
jgi:hypothetical protein